MNRYRSLRPLLLPAGMLPSPGAQNMRLDPGHVFTLDAGVAAQHARYLRNRVRVGDLAEVDELDAGAVDGPVTPPTAILDPVTSIALPLPDPPKGSSSSSAKSPTPLTPTKE